MVLTLNQATQAGSLATEINAVQSAIDQLKAAVAAGATSSEFSATVTINGSGMIMRAAIPMDAPSTASVFNQVITVYQGVITALTAQLAVLPA